MCIILAAFSSALSSFLSLSLLILFFPSPFSLSLSLTLCGTWLLLVFIFVYVDVVCAVAFAVVAVTTAFFSVFPCAFFFWLNSQFEMSIDLIKYQICNSSYHSTLCRAIKEWVIFALSLSRFMLKHNSISSCCCCCYCEQLPLLVSSCCCVAAAIWQLNALCWLRKKRLNKRRQFGNWLRQSVLLLLLLVCSHLNI